MTVAKHRKPNADISDLSFDEALARLIRTDNKELADAKDRIDSEDEGVRQYVEERRESIRSGARRSRDRFRL